MNTNQRLPIWANRIVLSLFVLGAGYFVKWTVESCWSYQIHKVTQDALEVGRAAQAVRIEAALIKLQSQNEEMLRRLVRIETKAGIYYYNPEARSEARSVPKPGG